jgi:BirA family biotin operon repressor/biotin-[acetyl-CoA-carboxylase] ligase
VPLPPLDVDALRNRLGPPWRRLDVVPKTGSTNADLLTRASAGEDIDGAVLIAEYQTAGRGRYQRPWSATPRGQITMSVGVAAADVPTDAWGWLTLAAGVAVADAVAATTGVTAALKWPNDVLAGPGKLAGILSEVAAPRPVVVIGVGLNVASSPDPAATSLADLGIASPDRTALVGSLLTELGRRIATWRAAAGADERLTGDYRTRCATLGTPVRVTLPGDREIVGTATAIDERGRLCVAAGDETIAVSAGDVVHLRPIHRLDP